MKKMLTWLLVLVVVLPAMVVLAEEEDFSVRNGIKFGMSVNEIIEIEKNNGNTDYNDSRENYLIYSPVNVAGIDGGGIWYQFSDDKLVSIDYSWTTMNGGYNEKNIDIDFKTINNTLESKYEKIGQMDSSGRISSINIERINNEIRFNGLTEISEIVVGDFNEYLAKNGDDYVVIFIEYYLDNSMFGKAYVLTVRYFPVDSGEYENIANQNEDIKNRQNTDL